MTASVEAMEALLFDHDQLRTGGIEERATNCSVEDGVDMATRLEVDAIATAIEESTRVEARGRDADNIEVLEDATCVGDVTPECVGAESDMLLAVVLVCDCMTRRDIVKPSGLFSMAVTMCVGAAEADALAIRTANAVGVAVGVLADACDCVNVD